MRWLPGGAAARGSVVQCRVGSGGPRDEHVGAGDDPLHRSRRLDRARVAGRRRRGRRAAPRPLRDLRGAIVETGGTEVKTIGDALMVSYSRRGRRAGRRGRDAAAVERHNRQARRTAARDARRHQRRRRDASRTATGSARRSSRRPACARRPTAARSSSATSCARWPARAPSAELRLARRRASSRACPSRSRCARSVWAARTRPTCRDAASRRSSRRARRSRSPAGSTSVERLRHGVEGGGRGRAPRRARLGRARHRQDPPRHRGRAHRARPAARSCCGAAATRSSASPYEPFAEALRHYVAAVPADRLRAELGPLGGELDAHRARARRTSCPGSPSRCATDAETERYRLFEAVADLLAEIVGAAARSCWCSTTSTGPTSRRCCCCATSSRRRRRCGCSSSRTYRDTDLDRSHPLADVLADLRREPGVERLDLQGLDAGEVTDFMERRRRPRARRGRASSSRAAVHTETEGNPFFVGEVLRHLAESGAIVQRDGRWTSDVTLADVGIPEGIREVVGRRLSRLSDAANRALAVARGDRPDVRPRDDRGRGRPDRRRRCSTRSTRRRSAAIIREVPGTLGRYTFAHALVRSDALRGAHDQPPGAHALAGRRGDRGAVPHEPRRAPRRARVPLRRRRAGRRPAEGRRVRPARRRAGAWPTSRSRPRRATSSGRSASLELVDDARSGGCAATSSCELDGRAAGGRRSAVRESGFAAAATARTMGDPIRVAEAAVAMTGAVTSRAGDVDEELVALLREALAGLDGSPSPLRARRAVAASASSCFWGPEKAEARRVSTEALAMARETGDPQALKASLLGSWTRMDGLGALPRDCAGRVRGGVGARPGTIPSATSRCTGACSTSPVPRGDAAGMQRHLAIGTRARRAAAPAPDHLHARGRPGDGARLHRRSGDGRAGARRCDDHALAQGVDEATVMSFVGAVFYMVRRGAGSDRRAHDRDRGPRRDPTGCYPSGGWRSPAPSRRAGGRQRRSPHPVPRRERVRQRADRRGVPGHAVRAGPSQPDGPARRGRPAPRLRPPAPVRGHVQLERAEHHRRQRSRARGGGGPSRRLRGVGCPLRRGDRTGRAESVPARTSPPRTRTGPGCWPSGARCGGRRAGGRRSRSARRSARTDPSAWSGPAAELLDDFAGH